MTTVLVVALVSTLLIVFLTSSTNKLLKAAGDGNLEGFGFLSYLDEIQEVHNNPRKLSKIEKAIKKQCDNAYEDFRRGKISYEAASTKIESYGLLAKLGSSTEKYVEGIEEKTELLNNSMLAYDLALDLEKNGDINGALLKYAEVVEDDKSYRDAHSRIEKLSNTFVEKLKTLEAEKDYRSIVMQGTQLNENRRITESAREQISTLVSNARAALKTSAEKLLTVEVREHDTGGTYLFATTEEFESTNNKGLKATLLGAIDPEESRASLGIRISFYPKSFVFINKAFIGSTDNNITGDADIETEYAGYGQYYTDGGKDAKYLASGVCGFFDWEELNKLYNILDGKEQGYIKVFTNYSSDSFSFPIPEELRLSILALLDYRLAIYKEKPTDNAS
jgi:hypothetical protein